MSLGDTQKAEEVLNNVAKDNKGNLPAGQLVSSRRKEQIKAKQMGLPPKVGTHGVDKA